MRKINEIILHHSASSAFSDTINDCKSIRNYHLSKGYEDIGYHYLIGADGLIVQGRDLDIVGAHCMGHNNSSIGICLIGDFTSTTPTNEQIASLSTLVCALRVVFGPLLVFPHCKFRKTLCPGKSLTEYCQILNSESYVSPVR